MADNKIGDFTNEGTISVEDVQYFLNGMKSGLFLDQSNVDFEKSNIALKHPFQGPDFYEVLKLHAIQQSASNDGTYGDGENEALSDLQTDGDNLDDYEFSLSSVVDETILHFGQKGASVDTYQDKIVVTFPRAKISNFFHAHEDPSTLVEKTIGYAKVYKIADTIDYSDYELILPPVFTNKSADSVPFDIEFGAESVAMHGNYIAVSAFYSRGPDAQNVHQPASAKVFLYEKVEASETSDPGYKFVSVFEDGDLACEPVLELHDDKLFVSDYVRNEIKVYSITTLKTLSNYAQPTAESKLVPRNIIRPVGDVEFNSEWGRSIVCRDGKNLYVGAPGAICKYSLPVATGMVEHWVYDFHEAESSEDGDSPDNPAEPWVLAQSLKPSESDLPWWTKYSEWSDTMCGANCITREYQYLQSSESEASGSQVSAMCGYTPGKYDEEGETIPIQARGDWWCNVWQQDTELADKTWTEDSDTHLNNWWEQIANQSDYPTTLSANDRANDWGVWFNEDLPGYYEPGPQGPVPIDYEWEIPTYMHFTTDIRFGETIDARGQKANATAPTNFDLEKQYVVVGAPRWFDDSVSQQENLSTDRIGAVFVFDSMYTTDEDTSRVNGGTSSQIKRITPTPQSSDTRVGAMEVDTNELEQNFYDADAVSVHFQMELYEQSDLVNRGSPSFWPYSIYDGPTNFDSNNVTFTWPEPAEMLHSDGTNAGGISAKGFMTFGAVDPETFSTWDKDYPTGQSEYSTKAGEALGYIKLGKNDSYSMNDDDLTIEFWWKPTHSYTNQTTADTTTPVTHTASTSAPIMSYQAEDSKDAKQWWDLIYEAGTGKLQLRYPNGSTVNRYSTEANYINVDTWYHIALVHEKREFSDTSATSNMRRIQLYVNGNPQFDYTDTGFTISDNGEASALNFDHKVEELESEDEKSQHLYIGASPGGLGTNIGSPDTGGFEGFGNHCFDDIRITHGVRYKQLMTDGDDPTEIGFTIPGSAFEICYHEKGHGADVAMDADYDIFILNNTLTGYIEKHTNERYNYDTDATLTSLDWSRTDMVSLSKDTPVIGGEISVYDTDLVYGNLNDLRIFPRNEDITISDGNIENRLVGGEAFEYKLETINSSYNYTVKLRGMGTINWGDGTTEVYDSRESYKTFSHQFSKITADMNITITGLTGFGESSGADEGEAKIVDVGESIPSTLIEFRNSFKGCTSFNAENTEKWNTRYVKSMMGMFSGATSFNRDISQWNTESLENASYMFKNATSFNTNISSWFTENVTNMASMFQGASAFDQSIDVWDVRNVENMDNMFNGASAFNQDLVTWCSKTITDNPLNFVDGSAMDQLNIPDWANDCEYGFVEFIFDVSEIEGEFTAVLPITRRDETADDYPKSGYEGNITYDSQTRIRDRIIWEYDWYVDWGLSDGNIRDTETVYEGGIVNEKWTHNGLFCNLQRPRPSDFEFTLENCKPNMLWHTYKNITPDTKEIKIRVHTSEIEYSDEYWTGYKFSEYFNDKSDDEKYSYNSPSEFERINERASKLYCLYVGGTSSTLLHTGLPGYAYQNTHSELLRKVTVKNVQLSKLNVSVRRYDRVGYQMTNVREDDITLDLSGVKCDRDLLLRTKLWNNDADHWPRFHIDLRSKVSWPVTEEMTYAFLTLHSYDHSNQLTLNLPKYKQKVYGRGLAITDWQVEWSEIKSEFDSFISNLIIDPVIGSDLTNGWKQNYVNRFTVWFSSMRCVNGNGIVDLRDCLPKNLNYEFYMWDVEATELLIPEINTHYVRLQLCNIGNQDEVCKKIQTPEGIEFKSVFRANKFTGDVDISHWKLVSTSDSLISVCQSATFSSIIFPEDFPLTTERITKFQSAFKSFTGAIPNIHKWKLSNSQDIQCSDMFAQHYTFNENLGTKKVTHLGQTYLAWDTQRVTSMDAMFSSATEFNGNISNWNVSKCSDFSSMFVDTQKFNRDISTKIITGDETYPSYIAWDTISGETFNNTLANAYAFEQDVSNWNMSKAETLDNFLSRTSPVLEYKDYTFDLRTKIILLTNENEDTVGEQNKIRKVYIAWDVSGAESIGGIAKFFDSPRKLIIDNWNCTSTRSMSHLVAYGSFNGDITTKNVNLLAFSLDYEEDSEETKTDQDKIIEQLTPTEVNQLKGDNSPPLTEYTAWNPKSLEHIEYFAYNNRIFNQDLSNWCVATVSENNVTMFDEASDAWQSEHKFDVNALGGTCPE